MSRFARFAPTLAAALALATFPATAQAAPAVVTRPAPSTPAYTTQADLDGDGRPDQITISVTRKTDDVWYYAIAVKTARGQRATARLSMGSADELAPKDVWQGAGPVDGAPGSEIRIVESDGGEAWSWQIYSWRNGKLLLQKDPSTGSVNWNDPEPWFGYARGYTVGTVGAVRQLVVHDLKRSRSGRFSGTHATFRWTKSGWKRVGQKPTGSLTSAQANALSGWHGVKAFR